MNFEEYRGIENLVVAKLTETTDETGNVTASYATPQRLAGVQAISGEVSESSETHYYDNMPAVVVDSEGADTYTLTVSVPDNKIRALIEGLKYDEATGALIGTQKEKSYFAIGFIAEKTSGIKEYNWIYKGKFTGGNKTHNTKNDGTDTSNFEYTFTSIATNVSFEKAGNKPCKYLSVEESSKVDLSKFFDKVTTPDELTAVA